MSTTNRNKVYITTNRNNTVLYVGSSSDLSSRIHKHKTKFYKGFTSKYNVDKLVYFESYPRITEAHKRERQVKKYRREKKEALINAINPEWNELDPNSDGN